MKSAASTILLPLLLILASCAASVGRPGGMAPVAEHRSPVTILISIDGFPPDYLAKGNTPVLDALAEGGVVRTMRPSFPTLTFPNHQAIITGLRPDRSGIVSNTMYDARRPGEKFTISDPRTALDPFWWDEAEPLWITAEKQGVRTATMFWPGSEVSHGVLRAGDWWRYDANNDGDQRVRTVLDWVRRPADIRPRFITLYFDRVDKVGHREGPSSQATLAEVRAVDRQIGTLRAGLAALGQAANLVILSDHGMAEVSLDRLIDLDRYVPRESYRIGVQGPHAGIDPLPGKEAMVEKALLGRHDHFQCWRKGELPARFRYGRHPRVPAIFCLTDTGWELLQGPRAAMDKGDHGFDNEAPDMRALFLVNGPAFRRDAALPALFDNVDVYPLLARLAGVAPLASDADPATLDALLAAP